MRLPRTLVAALALPLLTTEVFAGACSLPPDAQASLRPGHIVLVGEERGTNELPAFIGDLAACGLDKVIGVWVGLDMPSGEQDEIQAYLASDGGPVARKRLLSNSFWRRERQDGRSSAAMLALLERLRQLTAEGRNVRVFAFEPPVPEGVDPHKARAATLVKQLNDLGGKLAILLTDSSFASTVTGPDGQTPMGKRLRDVHRDLTALVHEVKAGEAFQCREQGCAVWAVEGADQGLELAVQLYPMPDARGFSGMIYTPMVTASPPATTTP